MVNSASLDNDVFYLVRTAAAAQRRRRRNGASAAGMASGGNENGACRKQLRCYLSTPAWRNYLAQP
jgi:hypothetical protein